jgi:tetratricopeptide (TPR) repeat protein
MNVRLTCLLLLSSLLAGCAVSSSLPLPPSRLMAAIEANNQAVSALSRAEYAQAERLYLKALAHDRAIENSEGVAINLIGLAVTYQRAGKIDAALRIASQVNARELPGVSSQRLGEAALLAASLQMAKSEWGQAQLHLDEAEIWCGPQKCALGGRIANLKAQLSIVANRIDEALLLARRAIELAEASSEREELANALRSAGNAALYVNPAEGVNYVQRALDIDKQLALSGKIYRDLVLLGRLQQALGEKGIAAGLYARARVVAEADGNEAAVREVVALETELGGEHGK